MVSVLQARTPAEISALRNIFGGLFHPPAAAIATNAGPKASGSELTSSSTDSSPEPADDPDDLPSFTREGGRIHYHPSPKKGITQLRIEGSNHRHILVGADVTRERLLRFLTPLL